MSTYFAQGAGAIQSIVWDTVPTGGGDVLVWANLQPDDVLVANGKAITWAAASVPTLTCARLTTAAEGGTAGGNFALSGSTAVAITANIDTCSTFCLSITHTGTGANGIILTGDVFGGTYGVADCTGISKGGLGLLTINGNLIGGSTYKSKGLYLAAGSVIVNAGTIQGGAVAAADACGILGNTSGTVAVTANNIIGGNWSPGIYASTGTGSWTITAAAITGGSNDYRGYGVYHNGTGTMLIYGPVTGGAAVGVRKAADGLVTINGTVSAGSAAAAAGATNGTTTPMTIIGSLVDSAAASAVAGKIYWQPASVAHYWQVAWNGSLDQRYTESPGEESVRYGLQFGYNGVTLMTGSMVVPAVTDVRAGVGYDDEAKTLGTLALPAEADVKAGVGYGGDGTEYTGTLVAGGGGVPLIGPGGLVG